MIRLLCAADIHLGRVPSRLPSRGELNPLELSPSRAWSELVDTAVRLKVDAVVLAGDVVEHDDDFYEAYVDLHAGVERLVKAGIEVVGVSGNHDVKVLPRLAAVIPTFRLLGQDGNWGSHLIERNGFRIRLVGRSFVTDRMSSSPLDPPPVRHGPEPHIGVLHCDRDATGSVYGPVRSSDLNAQPVEAWLLGHIHKPDDMTALRPAGGYLGSLSGSDPGESGPRGAWLLTVCPDLPITLEKLPFAPLRYDEVPVDVTGIGDAADVHNRVTTALTSFHSDLNAQPYRPAAVGLRLRLKGRSDLGSQIRQELSKAGPGETLFRFDGISYFVHSLRFEILPEIDIEQLARTGSPVGLLARKLRILQGAENPAERQELLSRGRERLQKVQQDRNFVPLAQEPLSDEAVAGLLEESAVHALEKLLAQQENRQ